MKYMPFTIFGVILLSATGCSQNDDGTSKQIPLVLAPNSSAQIADTHQKSANGKNTLGRIKASLEIDETFENGYIGTWTTRSVQVGGIFINENHPQAASESDNPFPQIVASSWR